MALGKTLGSGGGGGITQLTGDVTAGPGSGSQAATLATSGVSAGTYGSSTQSPVITVDAKGRIIAASNATIAGGGSLSVWDPEAPFSSPNSRDDEFTANTVDAKWTQVNAGSMSVLNTTSIPSNLLLTKTTNNTTKVALMQAIPSGDFSAFAKVRHTIDAGNFITCGLWLSNGTTAGAGSQTRVGLTYSSGYKAAVYVDSNWNAYAGTTHAEITPKDWGPYLRLTRSGTTFTFYVSASGVVWETVGSWTSGYSVTHLGLGYSHERAATTDECVVDFFRVVDGSATARLGNTRAD